MEVLNMKMSGLVRSSCSTTKWRLSGLSRESVSCRLAAPLLEVLLLLLVEAGPHLEREPGDPSSWSQQLSLSVPRYCFGLTALQRTGWKTRLSCSREFYF